jgi:exopolysaccharide biosynthesis protein
MKKNIITLLLLATLNASAPIPNYEPPLKDIKPHIIYKQITRKEIPNHENNGLSHEIKKENNNKYHIIRLEKDSPYELEIKTSKEPKYLEDIIDENTKASINASFIKNEKPIGLVRTNGQNKNEHQKIDGSGYFVIEKGIPNIIREMDDTTKYETILQSFPIIRYEGEPTQIQNGKKSYRSAIAIDYENNIYLIATNTHPLKQNKVTMSEFQNFLKTQNYKHVLNLDGGKSTQIHYQKNNQKNSQENNQINREENKQEREEKNREENKNYYMRNHRRINNAIIITDMK